MQFIGFVKFASTYFHQIEREVLLLLGNNSLGKATTENQADEISTVRVLQLFVIYTSFSTLLSFYIKKNGLFFSKSEACNFFVYIITHLAERLDLIMY